MRNRTEHGLSRLTAISDAGSTPAASTIPFLTSALFSRKGEECLKEVHSVKEVSRFELLV